MNFKKKVNFLHQCEENIDKLGFYLDLSDLKASYGPCLMMKKYYRWILKHIYKYEVPLDEYENHFITTIEKLDYKVVNNMEYIDFRDLLLAYFSLGEIYYGENKFDLAREYFYKATKMMEESLKAGNRYQTDEIQDNVGIVFFEVLMWARKNIGDMSEAAEALELYESIIGEEECLYMEKHYSIFKVAQVLKETSRVNEAARSIMKLLSTYRGANIEAIEYLVAAKDYENSLELIINEYVKNDITHWSNVVNTICREAEDLNEICVKKVLTFLDLLLRDLRIAEWSNLVFTLYNNVRNNEVTHIMVLNYLRTSFNKVQRNDFVSCGQAILVLKSIYEDIRTYKYEKEYLRKYEFDFTLYLMNTTIQNESYEKGLESSAKLEAIIEVQNINKDMYSYVEECLAICKRSVALENYNLPTYPWNYLYDNLKKLAVDYGIKDLINEQDMSRNISNRVIVGVNNLENKRIGSIINEAIGEKIFHKRKDVVFVASEKFKVEKHIRDNYSYEIIVKPQLLRKDTCIMTYENAKYGRIADLNVIIIDGHRELRDMDITYMKHVLKENVNNKILIMVESKLEDYDQGTINYNLTMIKNLLGFNKVEVVDVSDFKNKNEVISVIIGEATDNIKKDKFSSFNKDIKAALKYMEEDMKIVKAQFKERRYVVSECGREYLHIEDEIRNNHKEFSSKVKKDIEFLTNYSKDKINASMGDLLETRFSAIDDLDDLTTMKEKAEDILSRAVESWCKRNIYKLMEEQFKVYMSKYSKFYSFHEETVDRIRENRLAVVNSHPEFVEHMQDIEARSLNEVMEEILQSYEATLQSINYKVNIIPDEKGFNAVKEGIKVMFLKNEEKAENQRAKIKTLVLEDTQKISDEIINNIDEKLELLHKNLQQIIEDIFKVAKVSVANEKAMVDNAIKIIDEEYRAIAKKNNEIKIKMEFIEVEVLKYGKEVSAGMVYYEDKCYSLNSEV